MSVSRVTHGGSVPWLNGDAQWMPNVLISTIVCYILEIKKSLDRLKTLDKARIAMAAMGGEGAQIFGKIVVEEDQTTIGMEVRTMSKGTMTRTDTKQNFLSQLLESNKWMSVAIAC
jgi:hypothetical protein